MGTSMSCSTACGTGLSRSAQRSSQKFASVEPTSPPQRSLPNYSRISTLCSEIRSCSRVCDRKHKGIHSLFNGTVFVAFMRCDAHILPRFPPCSEARGLETSTICSQHCGTTGAKHWTGATMSVLHGFQIQAWMQSAVCYTSETATKQASVLHNDNLVTHCCLRKNYSSNRPLAPSPTSSSPSPPKLRCCLLFHGAPSWTSTRNTYPEPNTSLSRHCHRNTKPRRQSLAIKKQSPSQVSYHSP